MKYFIFINELRISFSNHTLQDLTKKSDGVRFLNVENVIEVFLKLKKINKYDSENFDTPTISRARSSLSVVRLV